MNIAAVPAPAAPPDPVAGAEVMQRQQAELRALFDLMPAMIWFKDTTNRILRVNKRAADSAGLTSAQIEGMPSSEIYPEDAESFYAADLEVIRTGEPKLGFVESLVDGDGNRTWVRTDKVPYRDAGGNVIGIVVMSQDVSEQKNNEARLARTHEELLDASRRAGMAEVATNVLHNVGNVLNSVNVSATLVMDSVSGFNAARLSEVAALLRAHAADLGSYITADARGRHIPDFLEKVAGEWLAQQRQQLDELASLRGHIDHIRQIVAMQQGYAKASGVTAVVDLDALVEDALRVQEDALRAGGVRVVREFGASVSISVEKHRVLQILVNLIRNAMMACSERGLADKCITLRLTQAGDCIRISVEDNGSGIAPENLTRIFAHGFTTRKDGHGFGLHSGAIAAGELGGSLRAESAGVDRGATFTLELPKKPPAISP
ncbi:MAG: PAS domain S-box protein [Usitatibacter sp.]